MKKTLKHNSKNRGFTLVELSIVIVIIGIIVGGVVLGSKVIDRARLAKVSSELSQIKQAYMMFDDTYVSVPGDYSGTTESATVCTTANTGFDENNVCKGNGNGRIEGSNLAAVCAPTSEGDGTCEDRFAINHLVYEDFLPASFSRRTESLDKGKLPKSFGYFTWDLIYHTGNVDSNISATNPKHVVRLEALGFSASILNATLSAKLDLKIDDGYPLTGMLGNFSTITNCITATATNSYALSVAAHCDLAYSLDD